MTNILHFDSVSSCYTGSVSDPFQTKFILSNPQQHIKEIHLKSIELPIGFFNVRNSGTLNVVSISINNVVYSITLTPKNYTSVASLCTDINTAFTSVNFGVTTTITFISSGNYISASVVSTGITQYSIVDTQLSQYILGLRSTNNSIITSGTSGIVTGTNIFNLNADNYLNMFLENIPADNNSNYNGKLCSFKISLNGIYGNIIFNNNENMFKQSVLISNQNFILRDIMVVFYDRFGNTISNNGIDYSFSLAFDYNNSDHQ